MRKKNFKKSSIIRLFALVGIVLLPILTSCNFLKKDESKQRYQVNQENKGKDTLVDSYKKDSDLINEYTTINGKKVYKQDLTKNYNELELENRNDLSTKNTNKYAPSTNEAVEGVTAKVVNVNGNAIEITNSLLGTSAKNLNIALVVPTTGKYAGIGNMIAETSILTMHMSKYADIGNIRVYNIGALPDNNWQEDAEVRRLLQDKNDIIIGSVFTDTTKKLLSVLNRDIYMISFSNDDALAKQYPNLTIFGMDETYKVLSLFEYLKDKKRRFLTLILPATKKGYNFDKLARELAKKYEIFVISSQFYQEGNKKAIQVASRGVSKNFNVTFMIDENGKFITETYKENKKKQQMSKNNNKNIAIEREKVQVTTDSVYIEANEADLSTIINQLENQNLLTKNVELFSDAILDTTKPISSNFDSVNFIGYNYQFIANFYSKFIELFKHEPNYFAYMTHDALTLLFYAINEGKMLPDVVYDINGFRGALDEFRFSRNGSVERRMSMYRIQNQILNRVYIPDDYFTIREVNALKKKIK